MADLRDEPPPRPEPPPAPPKKKLSENPRLLPEQSDISLRDLFAGLVLAGSVVDGPVERDPVRLYDADQREALANNCYAMADAMLARRQR